MSFILDALKKSESDRQRQNGPALFEVKVAPPRTRLPSWALAIAVLLIVNFGIVLWLLLRHPARAAAETPALTLAPTASVPAAPAPAPLATVTAAPATASPPAAGAPPPPPATAALASPPLPAPATTLAGQPSSAPHGAAEVAAEGTAEAPNPADYAPAQEPAADNPLAGHVRRGTAAGVPLYQDAAAVPGTQIPPLRLDLHVFSARVQDRFAMINMHKVHEGDTLPEGVHVDSITPEGAVLSYNGSRFLLPRE
jgi:general secretion pathway protein B